MQRYARNQKSPNFRRHLTQSDIDRARNVPIVEWLSAAGFDDRHRGKLYYSPFRDERTPSFAVNATKNLWYDHGEHAGGDIIELVMRLKSLSFAEAVKDLLGGNVTYSGDVYRHEAAVTELHPRKNFVVKDIEDGRLVAYAASRGISEATLRRYCKQAEYDASGAYGEFHSTVIAFPTDNGGYELRMGKNFKQGEGHKGIRVIAEDKDKNATYVVFEGFFNFLTYAEVMKAKGLPVPNAIILNSAGMWGHAAEYLRGHDISGRILLCLDNDKTGSEWTSKALKEFPNAIDMRRMYSGFNDLNDMMTGKPLETPAAETQKSSTEASSSAAETPVHDDARNAPADAETASAGDTSAPATEGTSAHPSAPEAAPSAERQGKQIAALDNEGIYMHVAQLDRYTITAYYDRVEAWLAGRGWMSFPTIVPFDYPKQLANKIVTLAASDISDDELKNAVNEYILANSCIRIQAKLAGAQAQYSMNDNNQ